MGKKKTSCTCHECELSFEIKITSSQGSRPHPQICPFCGDSVDALDERPFLKNFDEYDEFDDDEYYSDSDDEIDDE